MIMSATRVEVIGVHPISYTEDLLLEAIEDKYDRKPGQWGYRRARKHVVEELASAVQVELIIHSSDHVLANFDDGQFRQCLGTEPSNDDQVAWLSTYLNLAGDTVLSQWDPVTDNGAYRVVFFLHYFDEHKPLHSRWGPIKLPAKTPLPQRLANLCPYEPTD
jgi:hypothetical protein